MVATEPLSPRPARKFTADEVMRMLEAGILSDDDPVELLEGELVLMSPQSPTHASLTTHIRELLREIYGPSFHVRDHSTVLAGPLSLPEPDVALVRGVPRDYLKRHPEGRDTLLALEVSVSTRPADRRKARIYAAAGFPTYWIVDVEARRLEVRTGPTPDGAFTTTQLYDESATVALPERTDVIAVRELLP